MQSFLHDSLFRFSLGSHFGRPLIDGVHFSHFGCPFIRIFLVNEQGLGLAVCYSLDFQAKQGDVNIGGDLDLKTLTVIGTVSVGSPCV